MGFLSKDVGIDLGTANTLVYMKGKGIIMREPSVVAVDTKTDEVRCVGGEAKAVIGRTPGSIVAVRPLKDGVIADFDITTNMLENFLKKAADKQKVMDDFSEGKIDVLVSTTVVEVGVNVPNATVMMVENAERFGLAQLHQLRGRVGRGGYQSYCIFMTSSKKKETMQRLEVLNKSNDGFYIANEDLKLRGPGDFFGVRQSGMMDFVLADIYTNADIMKQAADAVKQLEESGFDFSNLKNSRLEKQI